MANMPLPAFLGPDTPFMRWMFFGDKEKTRLYNKIGQMVANGVMIVEAIERIAIRSRQQGASKATTAAVLERWRRNMLDGKRFSEAAASDLSRSDLVLLRAGEETGQFPRAVKSLLKLTANRNRIRSEIIKKSAYPIILLLALFIVMGMIAFMLVPELEGILPRSQWLGAGHVLDVMSVGFISYGPIIIAAMIALAVLIGFSMPRWTGRVRQRFDRLSPWSVYKIYHGVSFLTAVASLLHEGVKPKEALEIVMLDASPWYKERVSAAIRLMEDGNHMAVALSQTGFDFPDKEILYDLCIYEEMENFSDNMTAIADQTIDEAIMKISLQLAIFQNIAMLAIALAVSFFFFGTQAISSQVATSPAM